MEVRKAEIKDLDIVVQMKMDMFKEVGSVTLLQENAESKIYAKYKELYSQEKCCHYLVYETSKAIACGGAVYCVPEKRRNGYASLIMKELIEWLKGKGVHNVRLKPSAVGRRLYEKIGFSDSGEMEMWI